MKVEGNHTKEAIDEIVKRKDVKIVIIYDGWFDERIPDNWVKVSEWKISDNYVCTYDFVSFYATDQREVDDLKQNIMDYEDRILPDRVKVVIM